ncbi:MAG: response regulator [Clostridiales bacterium]|nr:response regulator [Clostridiales bacterium]
MEDSPRALIIVVDDSLTNLKTARNVLSNTFDIITAPSAEKMFAVLSRTRPDLILLDLEMPDMGGYEALEILKESDNTCDIPVIFLTSRNDPVSEVMGLNLGAVDYIFKPFSPALLRKRVEMHLTLAAQRVRLQEQNRILGEQKQELKKLQNAVLETVSDLVESRLDITGGHVERTRHGLEILTEGMNELGVYSEQAKGLDQEFFYESSLLHDVGKIAISDQILLKRGRLTPEEFEQMKRHTSFGGEIVDKIIASASDSAFLNHAKIFALTHHEIWDGTGYPNGLAGENIPIEGRLMAIADVYDALTSVLPYKKAFSHEDAVQVIIDGSGSHFDPALIEVFKYVAGKFKQIPKE